ncbi:ABC transporter ATP-binding protein [Mesosutterella sp. OilRF-GAM-744-9]|uniref:ABC transporter ATP-binding protein n=1 Tax=Mesosutterella porci TaxID=2915351 RepID=A0ABS9MRN0_9BURK|nr:ABC transporter ATP-binding protein [Mesosutterella sp. oilRF-744-WT-GAM-9]MCG5031285.1 ABC transporter ATP-binding protein [Mesosutterella sp. oilRF-744-WT-GAM-9]
MTQQPLLEVRNLTVSIAAADRRVTPVDGVSFSLHRGETLALVGESGCGKSLTALSVMRLLPEAAVITSGEVRLAGEDLLALPEYRMQDVRGRRIGLVFQEPSTSLNPVMTVGNQIGEVLRRHFRLTRSEARRGAVKWLGRVGIPEPERRAAAYPFELSGGQKQRCMIAMALAGRPDVLIADEPTTALDVTLQRQILDLLLRLKRETGLALLLITHDLSVVRQTADRVALMYAGQIVEKAPADEFFANPRHPYARQLLRAMPNLSARGSPLEGIPGTVPVLDHEFRGCRFAPRCLWEQQRCRSERPRLLPSGPGRWCACLRPELPEATGGAADIRAVQGDGPEKSPPEPVLEVSECRVAFPLRRRFPDFRSRAFRAVDGVSLRLCRGETLALVGESGSGKTTLGKAVLRLLPSRARISGSVRIGGCEVLEARGRALLALRRRAQMVFQDPYSSLDPRMTVEETLLEALVNLRPDLDADARRARMRRLLDLVGLGETALARYPHEFSGGQRQRISIARALAPGPQLLVCDEPTSALDVSVQAQILNLLSDIRRETSTACLLITHNFGVVEYTADRICVMKSGRIVESGEARDVLEHPCDDYTKALLAAVPSIGRRS